MKIIKQGNPHKQREGKTDPNKLFKKVCGQCGTHFIYNTRDCIIATTGVHIDPYVAIQCPWCSIRHVHTNDNEYIEPLTEEEVHEIFVDNIYSITNNKTVVPPETEIPTKVWNVQYNSSAKNVVITIDKLTEIINSKFKRNV